jgi:Phospholipase_D-nuclease N-terminal/Short C-terminal domain
MIATDTIGFWQAFFLFLIFIPLIMIWAFALFDIFRRDDISGGAKALWVIGVILLPFLGTLVYLLLRTPGATSAERAEIAREGLGGEGGQPAQPAADGAPLDATAPRPATTVDQLKTLADLHDAGKLTDEEFANEKAKLLAESSERS